MATTTPAATPPGSLGDDASEKSDSTTLDEKPQKSDLDPSPPPSDDGNEANDNKEARYDNVEFVWRCVDCLWEVSDGYCVGCGKEYEGPVEMLEYDQLLEDEVLADEELDIVRPPAAHDPPPSPWLSAVDHAEALSASPVNHNKNSTIRQKLRSAGAPETMIDEFQMYWHELDGAIAILSLNSPIFAYHAPDGFSTIKQVKDGFIMTGTKLELPETPQEWHVALGNSIDLDDQDASDVISHILDIMLDTAQDSDFYVPFPESIPVGEREELSPITVLQESPGSPAFAYSRAVRPGEVILTIDDELWLQLGNGKLVRIIKPCDDIDTPGDVEFYEAADEQAEPADEGDGVTDPAEACEQDQPADGASDADSEVEMEQAETTPEPSDSSEHSGDEHIKVESDASDDASSDH